MRPAHATEDVQKSVRLQLGLKVFIVLMVLAVLEYYVMVARVRGLIWYLVVIQVVEAGMIVFYFMHVGQLWRTEEQEPSQH